MISLLLYCLLLAATVLAGVVFRRLVHMIFGVQRVTVGCMRMMRALFVVPCFVMLGGFFVVRCGVLVMLGCLFVVISALVLCHWFVVPPGPCWEPRASIYQLT